MVNYTGFDRGDGWMREALRSLLTATSSRSRPAQIAAAVALGALCGFIPTSSLLFFMVLAVAYWLPIHLPLMLATTIVAALASPLLQTTFEAIGLSSLMHPRLHSAWLKLGSYPLIPWLGLHNTIVHGGLLFGLGTLFPIYLVTRPIAIWIMGAARGCADEDVGNVAATSVVVDSELQTELDALTVERQSPQAVASVEDLEALLAESAIADSELTVPLPTSEEVIARAVRVATLVDDVLSTLESEQGHENLNPAEPNVADVEPCENSPQDAGMGADTQAQQATPADSDSLPAESELTQESVDASRHPPSTASAHTHSFQKDGTVIEILHASPSYPETNPSSQHGSFAQHPIAENATLDIQVTERAGPQSEPQQLSNRVNGDTAPAADSQSKNDPGLLRSENRHQEALRYLLSHLRELKEKV